MAIQLLYDIAGAIESPEMDQVVRQAQQMIQQEFSDPELTAESVAVALSYHRGSLSRAGFTQAHEHDDSGSTSCMCD